MKNEKLFLMFHFSENGVFVYRVDFTQLLNAISKHRRENKKVIVSTKCFDEECDLSQYGKDVLVVVPLVDVNFSLEDILYAVNRSL